MAVFAKTLLAAGALMGFPGVCLAQGQCRPVDRHEIEAVVNDAVASTSPSGESALLVRLSDAWQARCRSAAERLDPAIVADVARLLDTRGFKFAATIMLYQAGDNARPVGRQVHRASIRMHRDFEAMVPRTAPDYVADQALQCLDVKLRTGRRVEEHCRVLDGQRNGRDQ
jgi:hypothetical protein